MSRQDLGKLLVDGVWSEDIKKVEDALNRGANINWVINGYPILIHAVFTRNKKMVMYLIHQGAKQVSEALGFALDRGLGDMVRILMLQGYLPKYVESPQKYGPYPRRGLTLHQL